MMAYHQIRTSTAHKGKSARRTPRACDLRWGLLGPASLSDVAEMWASAHAPPKSESASDAARFLRGLGVDAPAARAIAGVDHG
jgi:hypothetical protein